MAKVVLGKRPQSFKHTVRFPMLDGETGEITVAYKYRTRTEYGQFIDKIAADAGVASPSKDDKFSLESVLKKTTDHNADYLLQLIEAWDIEVELTRDSAKQLADEQPLAVVHLIEDYRIAINEGRLGN